MSTNNNRKKKYIIKNKNIINTEKAKSTIAAEKKACVWLSIAAERKHPALTADAKVNLSLQNAPLRSSALNTDANMMFAAAKCPLLQASTDFKPVRPRIRDGARN